MKKLILLLIWIAILSAMVSWLCSCATFKADVFYPDGTEVKMDVATLGKDVKADPNGLMSTVSPKDSVIIDAIMGGIAGFFLAGL